MVRDDTRVYMMEVETDNDDYPFAPEPRLLSSSVSDNQPFVAEPSPSSSSVPRSNPFAPESSPSSSSIPVSDPLSAPEPSSSSSCSLPNANRLSRKKRLEHYLNKILIDFDYSTQVNNCVVNYIKAKLKDDKKEAVNYINECFGEMLNDDNFLKWLADAVDYKVYSLRNVIRLNLGNKKDRSTLINHQAIYDFWVQNSITSNDSVNSTKKITKLAYLKQYKKIVDPDVREEEKKRKKSSNVTLIVATKRIYTESIRKLHKAYRDCHPEYEGVSLTVFFNLKPFYCLKPSEKEKQSCLCINCLNPHVILNSINKYRNSKKLAPHESLTAYQKELKSGTSFPEMHDQKSCKYNEYRRVIETYIGKDGKQHEYTRTARVDHVDPVFKLVEKLKDLSDKYLLHRTYVDNCASIYPTLKELYTGKFIELDFSQNLALRPKDEVQSAHFSG